MHEVLQLASSQLPASQDAAPPQASSRFAIDVSHDDGAITKRLLGGDHCDFSWLSVR